MFFKLGPSTVFCPTFPNDPSGGSWKAQVLKNVPETQGVPFHEQRLALRREHAASGAEEIHDECGACARPSYRRARWARR